MKTFGAAVSMNISSVIWSCPPVPPRPWGADLESLGRCANDGLLEMNAEGIRVTERGRFFLESLCSKHASSLDWDSAQWLFPKSR
jgi:hypothetical protein